MYKKMIEVKDNFLYINNHKNNEGSRISYYDYYEDRLNKKYPFVENKRERRKNVLEYFSRDFLVGERICDFNLNQKYFNLTKKV